MNKIMKTIKQTFALLIALLTINVVVAQNETFTIKIEVTGLKSSEGKVLIEVLDKNQQSVADAKGEITNNKSVVEFKNLPAGTYAIQYYHDENNNDEMDTGMFGIPLEGYGFSNDARGFMGPPDFEDELFNLDRDLTLVLTTKN